MSPSGLDLEQGCHCLRDDLPARTESDAQWIDLSRSTDHDNVAPEMLDPLAHL